MIGFLLCSRANALKVDKTFVALHIPIDTSDVKNGFNNLFLASVSGTNGARLNPRAMSFVQDFMIRNREEMDEMKSWGRPYFNLIDGILSQYGLPSQLKYLAVIESNLKPTALSWAGAVGPWQLMPATARLLGLKVTKKVDERKNYYKSTKAAAIYLRDLYTELGDWLLVIAAYNGGTGNVYKAEKRATVWISGPTLRSSLAMMLCITQATGARKPGPRGDRDISRKTIAQGMPDDPAEPVVTAACFFCCRRAMGEAFTRHSLRPLRFSRGSSYLHHSGANASRDRVEVCS